MDPQTYTYIPLKTTPEGDLLNFEEYGNNLIENFARSAKVYLEKFGEPEDSFVNENDPILVKQSDILRRKLANRALKHYNDTEGVEFELVDVMGIAYKYTSGCTCYHLTFEAKESNKNLSQQLFFAEVCLSLGIHSVNISCIVSGSDADSGCEICQASMLHPKGVAFFGCHEPARELYGSDSMCHEAADLKSNIVAGVCGSCGRAYDD